MEAGVSFRTWQGRILASINDVPVAWLDPQTGAVLSSSRPVGDLQTAYLAWRDGWQDLASNVPGQQLREQVRERRAEMGKLKILAALAFDAKTDERAWRVGAEGERRVGTKLNRLTKHGFLVLHSVPIGAHGSDIDHLLIGPPGVFTINTKNHPGGHIWLRHDTVKVNGHNQPYVRNSRWEVQRVEALMGDRLGWTPPVRGVIVVMGDKLTVKDQPEGAVSVIGAGRVPRCFRRWPQVLAPEHVQAVFAVARRSTTWAA